MAAAILRQAAERNLFGEDEDVLYVKGSGWDLETIEPAGFTPLALGMCAGWRGCAAWPIRRW